MSSKSKHKIKCIAFYNSGERCGDYAEYGLDKDKRGKTIKSYCKTHWDNLIKNLVPTKIIKSRASKIPNILNTIADQAMCNTSTDFSEDYNVNNCPVVLKCDDPSKPTKSNCKYVRAGGYSPRAGAFSPGGYSPGTPRSTGGYSPGTPRTSGGIGTIYGRPPSPLKARAAAAIGGYTMASTPRTGAGAATTPKITAPATGSKPSRYKDEDLSDSDEGSLIESDGETDEGSGSDSEESYSGKTYKYKTRIDDGTFKRLNGKDKKFKDYGKVKIRVNKDEVRIVRGRYDYIRNDEPPYILVDGSMYSQIMIFANTLYADEALQSLSTIRKLIEDNENNESFKIQPEKWSVEESVIDYVAEKLSPYITDRERLELLMMYLFDYDRRDLKRTLKDFGFTKVKDSDVKAKELLTIELVSLYKISKDNKFPKEFVPRVYYKSIEEKMLGYHKGSTDAVPTFVFMGQPYGGSSDKPRRDKPEREDNTNSNSTDDFGIIDTPLTISQLNDNVTKIIKEDINFVEDSKGIDKEKIKDKIEKFLKGILGDNSEIVKRLTISGVISSSTFKSIEDEMVTLLENIRNKIGQALYDKAGKGKKYTNESVNSSIKDIASKLNGKLDNDGQTKFRELKLPELAGSAGRKGTTVPTSATTLLDLKVGSKDYKVSGESAGNFVKITNYLLSNKDKTKANAFIAAFEKIFNAADINIGKRINKDKYTGAQPDWKNITTRDDLINDYNKK
jgi:hypothetical protein